jgi:hypothetical protein
MRNKCATREKLQLCGVNCEACVIKEKVMHKPIKE